MKRKRDMWDFGESVDLYNTDQSRLAANLEARYQAGKVDLLASSSSSSSFKIPDMIQRKRHLYSLERDKRVQGDLIRRDIRLYVPEFLRESLWRRHAYSLQDVICALKACPKEFIWQLALYYNVQILNAASRPSSCFIIRGGKSSAIDRTETEFLKEGSEFRSWRQRPSVLLKTKSCYKDPMYLPFHFVSSQSMQLLVGLLPESSSSQKGSSLGQPLRQYSGLVHWKQQEEESIALVPLSVYWRVLPRYDFVLVNRVLPYDAYCARYALNTAQTPLSEWVDAVYVGSERFALLEEAFYAVNVRPE